MRLIAGTISCCLSVLLIYTPLAAQPKFQVGGKMRLEKGKLEGKVELLENGSRKSVRSLEGSGKFSFDLEVDQNYVLEFSQEGYVTKKIAINTKVDDKERKEYGFIPFDFQVTLFKQYEGVNFVVFNQPVAQIKYSPEIGDFDYDLDYTKSIQQRLDEIEKEVAEKSREEDEMEKTVPKVKEEPKPTPPKITAETEVKREDPPTRPHPKPRTPPPPPPQKQYTNVVVLHAYTVGELGYPNLSAYGFINFGDGAGRREITKEQFDKYAETYR